MKERPILFSAPMVQAILDGRKTQTRRAVKPQPAGEIRRGEPDFNHWIDAKYWERQNQKENRGIGTRGFACPYGQPGDRLWVRETWQFHGGMLDCGTARSSAGSSLYQNIVVSYPANGVRVELLQEIDIADAQAEGVSDTGAFILDGEGNEQGGPIAEYAVLWDQINGDGSWESNPWVWVVEFKAIEAKP